MIGWWRRRTLRTRITVVVAVVTLAALLALSRFAAGLVFSALLEAGDAELRAEASTAAGAVAAGRAVPPPVRVVDIAGTPTDGRGPLPLGPAELRALTAGGPVTAGGAGGTGADGPGRPGPGGGLAGVRRWAAVPVSAPDGTPRLVLASRDVLGAASLLVGIGRGIVLAVLGVTLAVAAAAWLATWAALRPVDRMRRAAAALPAGQRLPVPTAGDELGALATELNALLARRDEAADRLRRFTGDAAHELRSPVAAVRAQAEVAVAHPDAVADGAAWRSVAADAGRMSALVTDLLALARADAGALATATPVDLGAAVRAAVTDTPDDVPVDVWAPAAVAVLAGPGDVALVVGNLLANACRHASSVVQVAVLPAGRRVRLVVDDDGPGIPVADRERVFERFVRLDPAAPGGSGLGLALVREAVLRRGGTVRATTSPAGGARLVVTWPGARPSSFPRGVPSRA